MILYIVIQVILALVIVFAVYKLSLWILKQDQLASGQEGQTVNHRDIVKVVDGYAFTSVLFNRNWNMINMYKENYLPIKPSFNRKGGIQFSYSFWINMQNVGNENIKWKDIILKGDPESVTYTVTRFKDDADKTVSGSPDPSVTPPQPLVAVKCPRIRFGPTYDSIQIELNTLHNPDERILIRSIKSESGTVDRQNAVKLVQNRWAMMTFTFEDHVAINTFEDGITVRFYLNDVLYYTKNIKSAMRPNKSALHMFPSIDGVGESIHGSRIGNVFYYNWALDQEKVRDMYARGPPKKMAYIDNEKSLGDPLYLNEYNKADIYNT